MVWQRGMFRMMLILGLFGHQAELGTLVAHETAIGDTIAAMGPYSAIASRGNLSCDTQSGSPYLVGFAPK